MGTLRQGAERCEMSIHQMNQVRTTAHTAAVAVDVADSSSSDAPGAFDTAGTAAAAENFSVAIREGFDFKIL